MVVNTTKSQSLLICLFIGLLAAFWVATSQRGTDYRSYSKWAEAAASGDITKLDTKQSIMGVPFSNWYAGPGMLAAPIEFVSSIVGYEECGLRWSGFIAALTFWVCLWLAIRELTDASMATWGALTACCATPLGYYTFSVSSETLTFLPLGVLALCFARLVNGKPVSALTVAAATGLILMFRPYVAVYSWPVIWLIVSQQPSFRQRLRCVGIIGLAIVVAIFQLGVVNYWMKDSPLQSPYAFGDADFRSFDSSCPHLMSVLLDTFHGLFPSHPYVVIGVGCLGVLTGKAYASGSYATAVAWGLYVLAAAVHLYFQGCWFYWWLGETSFAMRGMIQLSVPSVLGVSVLVWNLSKHELQNWWAPASWVANSLVFACCLWSGLLWHQGPMDYLAWDTLIAGQLTMLEAWFTRERLPFLLFSAPLALVPVIHWNGNLATRLTCFFSALILLAHLAERSEFSTASLLVVYGVGLATFVSFWVSIEFFKREAWQWKWVSGVSLTAFIVCLMAFVRLSVPTFMSLQKQESGFAQFNVADTTRAYMTLTQLAEQDPRFESQMRSLEGYLERRFGHAWILSTREAAKISKENYLKFSPTKTRKIPAALGLLLLSPPDWNLMAHENACGFSRVNWTLLGDRHQCKQQIVLVLNELVLVLGSPMYSSTSTAKAEYRVRKHRSISGNCHHLLVALSE